jgi:hypothetical protein
MLYIEHGFTESPLEQQVIELVSGGWGVLDHSIQILVAQGTYEECVNYVGAKVNDHVE